MQQNYSSNNKRIAKNTIFLYFRSILIVLISLYTSRIVLHALGVNDYGIYNVVGGVVSMFGIISNTLASATQRFITFTLGENDADKLHKVFSNSITLHIIIGILITVLLEAIGVWILFHNLNIPHERIYVANIVMQCSIATLFINIISLPYNALIIAHEKMSAFAYISIVDAGLKLLIALALTYGNYDKLILFACLHFLESCLLRLIYSMYSRKNFQESRNISFHINREIFNNMFSFAGWNFIGQGALVLRNQGVDIVINLFFGVSVNAAKGICNQISTAVTQFTANFTTALKPQLTKSIAQQDYSRTYELITQGTRFSFYLMLLFAVPIWVSCRNLMELWLSNVPKHAVEFVRWTMVYLLIQIQSRLLVTSISATGKIRNYQVSGGILKMLAIPMVYIAYKYGFSPKTFVWIYILIALGDIGLTLYFNKKLIKFPVNNFLMMLLYKCYLVLLPCWIIPWLLNNFVNDCLLLVLPICALVCVLVIYLLGLTPKERMLLKKWLKDNLVKKGGNYEKNYFI